MARASGDNEGHWAQAVNNWSWGYCIANDCQLNMHCYYNRTSSYYETACIILHVCAAIRQCYIIILICDWPFMQPQSMIDYCWLFKKEMISWLQLQGSVISNNNIIDIDRCSNKYMYLFSLWLAHFKNLKKNNWILNWISMSPLTTYLNGSLAIGCNNYVLIL